MSTTTHPISADYAHHTSLNCPHQKLDILAALCSAQSGVLLFYLNLYDHTVKGDGRPNVKKGKEMYFRPPLMDAHHRYWYHYNTQYIPTMYCCFAAH